MGCCLCLQHRFSSAFCLFWCIDFHVFPVFLCNGFFLFSMCERSTDFCTASRRSSSSSTQTHRHSKRENRDDRLPWHRVPPFPARLSALLPPLPSALARSPLPPLLLPLPLHFLPPASSPQPRTLHRTAKTQHARRDHITGCKTWCGKTHSTASPA